jgi:hypothetical protein
MIALAFTPAACLILLSWALVITDEEDEDELLDSDRENPGGPIRTTSGVITMVFAPAESWSFTWSCIFVPSIPIDEIAITPITIPMDARIERMKFRRTLRTERSKKISLMILRSSRLQVL